MRTCVCAPVKTKKKKASAFSSVRLAWGPRVQEIITDRAAASLHFNYLLQLNYQTVLVFFLILDFIFYSTVDVLASISVLL